MGDILDLEKRRKEIQDAVVKEPPEGVYNCPKCGDMFCMLVAVPEHTDVDAGGPYAVICQHCDDARGVAYEFDEDDEDESEET